MLVGDAGMFSTIEDLAKWESNFSDARVGGQAAIAAMTEPGRLNNGQKIPYGFALVLGEMRGMKTIAHSGAFGGFRTEFLRFPEVDIGVVTLCNTSTVPSTLAEQIGTLMLGVTPQRFTATVAPLDMAVSPYASGTVAMRTDSASHRLRRGARS